MSKFLIKIVKLYQRTPLHSHSNCRFIPTCSEYMIIALERFGTIDGLKLGIKRILRCHPNGKSGIDLVPENKKKALKNKIF